MVRHAVDCLHAKINADRLRRALATEVPRIFVFTGA
jgi:hypothetical protein